jgi:hypothetical protein
MVERAGCGFDGRCTVQLRLAEGIRGWDGVLRSSKNCGRRFWGGMVF